MVSTVHLPEHWRKEQDHVGRELAHCEAVTSPSAAHCFGFGFFGVFFMLLMARG